MKSIYKVATFVAALIAIPAAFSTPAFIDLGAAADYNAFIRNNFTATSSDVEGRLAVGGDLSLSSYSVNVKNGGQLYQDTESAPAVVTGGDFTFGGGNVAGDVYVGGDYSSVSWATVSNGSVTTEGPSPIDFESEFDKLSELSKELSSLDSNSSAAVTYSTQYYTAGGEELHVFNLTADDLSSATDYQISGVEADDLVLFNVSGTHIKTTWGNYGGSDNSLGAISDRIIYNFYEAALIEAQTSLFGTVLAPEAEIVAPQGVIWGQIIADSWNGNMQINDSPFAGHTAGGGHGEAVDIPEPASWAIFSLGLAGLLFKRRAAPKLETALN